MDDLLDVLGSLRVMARLRAERVLLPGESLDAAWSLAADEYCLRMARHMEAEEPTPEVAAALLPRLKMIDIHGSAELRILRWMGRLGDATLNDEGAILIWLLIHKWHLHWKDSWNAGADGGAGGHTWKDG